jgi:hypothetical protein
VLNIKYEKTDLLNRSNLLAYQGMFYVGLGFINKAEFNHRQSIDLNQTNFYVHLF